MKIAMGVVALTLQLPFSRLRDQENGGKKVEYFECVGGGHVGMIEMANFSASGCDFDHWRWLWMVLLAEGNSISLLFLVVRCSHPCQAGFPAELLEKIIV